MPIATGSRNSFVALHLALITVLTATAAAQGQSYP